MNSSSSIIKSCNHLHIGTKLGGEFTGDYNALVINGKWMMRINLNEISYKLIGWDKFELIVNNDAAVTSVYRVEVDSLEDFDAREFIIEVTSQMLGKLRHNQGNIELGWFLQ